MREFEYESDIKLLEKVGKVSRDALDYARIMIKPDMTLLEIANNIERFMADRDCVYAFPTNLSLNNQAAHYTPTYDDDIVVKRGDILKVDLGARDGDCITDCAITLNVGEEPNKMIEACDSTLETAISKVRAGTKLHEIGRVVEDIVKAKGFNPIKNLGGHGVAKGELHADIFIPNYDNGDETELEEGQVVAVEVFITDGMGFVEEGDEIQIFQKSQGMPRTREMRQVAEFIDTNYRTYPFAFRWLMKQFDSEFRVKATLNELLRSGYLDTFPVLVEGSEGLVAQCEKTVLVEKDSCKIIT